MQGAPAQEVIPEEKGKRVAPTGADYSARCHCLTLTVARLGLATRLLSFASEPLSGRGVEASLLGRPTAMVHLRGFGGRCLAEHYYGAYFLWGMSTNNYTTCCSTHLEVTIFARLLRLKEHEKSGETNPFSTPETRRFGRVIRPPKRARRKALRRF